LGAAGRGPNATSSGSCAGAPAGGPIRPVAGARTVAASTCARRRAPRDQ